MLLDYHSLVQRSSSQCTIEVRSAPHLLHLPSRSLPPSLRQPLPPQPRAVPISSYQLTTPFSVLGLAKTDLCQTTKCLHIALLIKCPLQESPSVLPIGVDYPIRASTAAIVAPTSDNHVLKTREKSSNLVWYDAQGVIAAIFGLGYGGCCNGASRVLKDRDQDFDKECRSYCRNTGAGDGALLVESPIRERLDHVKDGKYSHCGERRLTSAGATTSLQK